MRQHSGSAAKKLVYLDLCDNVFVPGYAQRRGPELSVDTVNALARQADGIVTPTTTTLDRVVRAHLHPVAQSWVISDAALAPDAYQAIGAWLSGQLAEFSRWGVDRLLPTVGRTGADSGADFAVGVATDWQADHLPVVASYLESLEPLRDAFIIDVWVPGSTPICSIIRLPRRISRSYNRFWLRSSALPPSVAKGARHERLLYAIEITRSTPCRSRGWPSVASLGKILRVAVRCRAIGRCRYAAWAANNCSYGYK